MYSSLPPLPAAASSPAAPRPPLPLVNVIRLKSNVAAAAKGNPRHAAVVLVTAASACRRSSPRPLPLWGKARRQPSPRRCAAAESLPPQRRRDGGAAPPPRRPAGPARGGAGGSNGRARGSGKAAAARRSPAGVRGGQGATAQHLSGGHPAFRAAAGDGGAPLSPSPARRAGYFSLGGRSEETVKLSDLVRLFFFSFFPLSPPSCRFASSLMYFAFPSAASCVGRSPEGVAAGSP